MSERVKMMKEEERVLPCKLTNPEIQDRGEKLAALHADLNKFSVEEDAVKADLKKRRAKIETAIEEMADVVRKREEYRTVRCAVMAHYNDGVVQTMRMDTGEKIEERKLTSEERQAALFVMEADREN